MGEGDKITGTPTKNGVLLDTVNVYGEDNSGLYGVVNSVLKKLKSSDMVKSFKKLLIPQLNDTI